ncbi:non-ribosomal peptide synthetase [Streptomyces parvulus]|uniref:non-ribosomal peptide synthetase n=1 Tax=Streptomyces parvulus TaxID=146923 RepID=UPI0037F22D6A
MKSADTVTARSLVCDIVTRYPEHVAIECGSESLTYRQLWEAAGSVAAQLLQNPLHRPDGLVAVLFARGIPGIVAQLGVWRSGAAYLPLDPGLPMARISSILDDAEADLVLTQEDLKSRLLPGTPAEVTVSAGPGAAPLEDCDGAAAYVIYTSGSTGTPKGVCVGPSSLANLLTWHRQTYNTGPGIRVAAFAGLGFDASVWEVWATLGNGGTLVLPPDRITADIDAVRDFLDDNAINHCFLSTPLAEQLFAAPRPPESLQVLLTGGDRLRLYPPKSFPAAVFNHYGPTEATVVTTASMDLRVAHGHTFPAIGRPIAGAAVRLSTDSGASITEVGVAGELLIGGEILANGYHRDEALTQKNFAPDTQGLTWYHTGDICRWTASDELEFVERRDTQVSLRGHRIELAEIEQEIMKVDGVAQASVVFKDDQDGGALLGFFSGNSDEVSIRAHLQTFLPRYMLPAAVHHTESMPLNANGKIDRALLMANVPDIEQAPAANIEALSTTAERIARTWAEVLGRAPEPTDNFFEIGGHSLMAARVTGQVRKEFGIALELGVIFDSPVLTEYAQRVDELARSIEG